MNCNGRSAATRELPVKSERRENERDEEDGTNEKLKCYRYWGGLKPASDSLTSGADP